MKPESVASLVAAVLVHALLLFGFHIDSSARPLATSDQPAPVDVSLVASAPTPPAAATPTPLPTPEPAEPQTPAPPPAPSATPEPMATPEAMPTPAPHPLEHPDRPRAHRHSIPRTAPGSAAAASHTAPDHGVAGRQPNSGAHYLSNPKPEYPEKARALHQQGVVLLGVEVGADGRPSEVTITRSSGFPELDQAAVRAVRRWTFEPARAGGLPVSSRVVVPVHFSLED